MLSVFIDDSGTDQKQPVVVAAALIVPGHRLNSLHREWERFDAGYKFNGDLHSSVCAARNKEYVFGSWSEIKVRNAFRRARQIMKSHACKAQSLTINKEDFRAEFPEEWLTIGGNDPFTWCFHFLLQLIRTWNLSQCKVQPIEYFIDWIEPHEAKRKEIERLFAQFESAYPGEYKDNYQFRARKNVPGLQCVDHLAWACFGRSKYAFHNIPMLRLAESAFADLQRTPGGWLDAMAHTREMLAMAIREDQQDQAGEEQRRVWYRNWLAEHAPKSSKKRKRRKLSPT